MVTGNTYRHPAVLAHIAATVDVISNGRLDFGIGAGWNEYEHESMGIPLYPPGERIRRLGEACEIIKLLFTQPLTDFDGRYYQLKEARLRAEAGAEAVPAVRDRRQRRAADPARGGAATPTSGTSRGADVETFRHKVRVLHEHCAAVGRDPGEIELSVQARVDYDDLPATVATLQRSSTPAPRTSS